MSNLNLTGFRPVPPVTIEVEGGTGVTFHPLKAEMSMDDGSYAFTVPPNQLWQLAAMPRAVTLHVVMPDDHQGKPVESHRLKGKIATDQDGVHVSVREEDLPQVMKIQPPTPPERQLVSAVNAGAWLALSQWADWMEETRHELAPGVRALLNSWRMPMCDGPYSHYWMSERWYGWVIRNNTSPGWGRVEKWGLDHPPPRPGSVPGHALSEGYCLNLPSVGTTEGYVTSLPVYGALSDAYAAAARAVLVTEGKL